MNTAWDIWQGRPRRFTEESAVLPALITDVQAAQRTLESSGTGEDRRQGHQLAADLYFLLRTYAKRIGRNDLALLVADRGVVAAQAANDPFRIAAAQWNLGHVRLAQGDADGAEDVASQGAEVVVVGREPERVDAVAREASDGAPVRRRYTRRIGAVLPA